MEKFKIYNNNLRLFLIVLMNFLFGMSYLTGNIFYNFIGIFILAFLIFTGKTSDDIYTYVSLIPFSDFVAINDKNILFIFLLLSVVKLIFKNSKQKLNLFTILLIVFFISNEFISDFFNVSIGRFIYIISILLYFIIFIIYFDFSNFDSLMIIKVFIYTLLLAIGFIIYLSNGDLTSSLNQDLRFGEKARELGGSMGIPIYCLMLISSFLLLLTKYKVNIIKRTIIYILIPIILILGLLTLSRVYILGLSIFVICIIVSLLQSKNLTNNLIIIAILAIIGVVYINLNIDFFISLISKIINRGSEDISTGRFAIYDSIFNYLSNNKTALLFGRGIINYVQIGVRNRYLFGMMAHNLYLDGLMSWGIFGLSSFIYFIYLFIKRCKIYFNKKISIFSATPLIIWCGMVMTGDTFNFYRTYFYILVLILVMLSFSNKKISKFIYKSEKV